MAEKQIRADAPTDSEDRVYHLRLRKGDVGGYVVITGDPANTAEIASLWSDARELAYNREYRTFAGSYHGLPLSTTSSGVGCQSSELVINELLKVGAHTCIKVGTASSIDPSLKLGDLIVPMACMRKGGAADLYVEPEFPAFPDLTAEKAIIEACERLGFSYSLGVNYSVSSFFIGQGRRLNDDPSSYWPSWAQNVIMDLQSAGISSIDMDTAGQFIVGYLHEMRMGAILSIICDRTQDKWGDNGGSKKAAIVASEALSILAEWDSNQRNSRQQPARS